MAYEFKKLSDVEVVAEPMETANVLIEEDGVIKKAPKTAVGGGGASSWNDLKDRPFGDMEKFVYSTNLTLSADGTSVTGNLPTTVELLANAECTIKINGEAYKGICNVPYPGIYQVSSNEKTENDTNVVYYSDGYLKYTKDEWEKAGSAPETFDANIEFYMVETVVVPDELLPSPKPYTLGLSKKVTGGWEVSYGDLKALWEMESKRGTGSVYFYLSGNNIGTGGYFIPIVMENGNGEYIGHLRCVYMEQAFVDGEYTLGDAVALMLTVTRNSNGIQTVKAYEKKLTFVE